MERQTRAELKTQLIISLRYWHQVPTTSMASHNVASNTSPTLDTGAVYIVKPTAGSMGRGIYLIKSEAGAYTRPLFGSM